SAASTSSRRRRAAAWQPSTRARRLMRRLALASATRRSPARYARARPRGTCASRNEGRLKMATPTRDDALLMVQLARWSTELGFEDALPRIFADDFDPNTADAFRDESVRTMLTFGESIGTLTKNNLLSPELVKDKLRAEQVVLRECANRLPEGEHRAHRLVPKRVRRIRIEVIGEYAWQRVLKAKLRAPASELDHEQRVIASRCGHFQSPFIPGCTGAPRARASIPRRRPARGGCEREAPHQPPCTSGGLPCCSAAAARARRRGARAARREQGPAGIHGHPQATAAGSRCPLQKVRHDAELGTRQGGRRGRARRP